jgi:hypothetical protein
MQVYYYVVVVHIQKIIAAHEPSPARGEREIAQ